MSGESGDLGVAMDGVLRKRGWQYVVAGSRVSGRRLEWPPQLRFILDLGGDDHPPVMALALDFRSMPLGGERFRDIFNADREELLGPLGTFTVRQVRGDEVLGREMSESSFLHGMGDGVSRQAQLVVFDRRPVERGEALLERFGNETNRFVEVGNEIASLLQRTYQRTVLGSEEPVADLPEVVAPATTPTTAPPAMPAVVGGTVPAVRETYPWRR
ncbi:MAG: hypothetical protein QOE92_2385 [Chloroflexota bacterium]|jgi:hypothetical protein|nr:hypothetical protein [Chloroflexota bacterium]